jgi:hypothetical protein
MKYFKRDTVAFCAAGYNDACIHFLLQFSHYGFDEAEKCIRNVKEYNDYNGAKVANAFKSIVDKIDKVSFGREGSPVLYLRVKTYFHDGEEYKKNPGKTKKYVAEIIEAFKDTVPDETYMMNEAGEDSTSCVRLWWD